MEIIKIGLIILFTSIYLFIMYILYFNYTNEQCPFSYKILVSGSSDNHFHLLLLFLHRVNRVENNICIILWNLGLSYTNEIILNKAKKYVNCRKKVVYIHKFNFDNYPQHFNINENAGYYSWKPFVIWNTYIKYKRSILWLDCGCFVKSNFEYEYNVIKTKKIYSIGTSTSIKKLTHNSLFTLLSVNKSIYYKTMCAAGVVGIFYPSIIVNNIFSLWKACALIKNCIAPLGSNRSNHRQDQSVFSILLYQNNFDCGKNDNKAFSIHFDLKYSKYRDELFYKFLNQIQIK